MGIRSQTVPEEFTVNNSNIRGPVQYRKISGFTLMEQIIVMAITSILILMGFLGLTNIQRLLEKIRETAQKDRGIYLFTSLLQKDFRDADSITWDGELKIMAPEQTIKYLFEKKMVRRATEASVDTFRMNLSEINVLKIPGKAVLVSGLSFILSSHEISYPMNFVKKYPDHIIFGYGN